MRLTITPFASEHLEGTATLLAHRHRRDHERCPLLPAQFAEPTAALSVLKATAGLPRTSGTVALERGRVVGYLLGTQLQTPAHSRNALFVRPQSVFISYASHAVDPDADDNLLAALYAAAVPAWISESSFTHYVQVNAADSIAIEQWSMLGFGRDFVTTARNTKALPADDAGVDIRRATPGDLDAVMGMTKGLYRYHAEPPMCVPYLPEVEADERAFQQKLVAHSASAAWLAYRDGRPVAMQSFQPPPASLSPLLRPARSIYLLHAFANADERGRGVNRALLSHSVDWARHAGHEVCVLNYLSANAPAARFWWNTGFRPIEYRLCRRLDERIASAQQ